MVGFLLCLSAARAEPRAHLDAATQAVYDRLTGETGWLLGCGRLFAPPEPGRWWQTTWPNQRDRWTQLYGDLQPAVVELEMGEANQPRARREWSGMGELADRGALPWMMLSLNNFTVPLGGRERQRVVGGMNDTTGGLDPVLPGGTAHDRFVAYLTTFAREVKAFGRPCVLRPFHEMNGGWFWWGGQPEPYRRLWREVFELFRAEGVTNVLWCWAPSSDTPGLAACYPGDELVDILGASCYFREEQWPDRVRQGMLALAGLAPGKPVWLAELGPLATESFWREAPAAFAAIPRLRGFNLWLARGWQAWGRDPARGSLIDDQSPAAVREAFLSFLRSDEVVTLAEWTGR